MRDDVCFVLNRDSSVDELNYCGFGLLLEDRLEAEVKSSDWCSIDVYIVQELGIG
jgi:hypothetical protein